MSDDVTARDDRLRELAQAATPGPWSAREGDLEGKPASEYVRTLLANREADGTSTGRLFLTLAPNPIDPERGAEVVPALTGDGPSAEANAAYIAAASPDVVLGLLDRLAAVEAERDRLAAVVERVKALADEWVEDYPGPTAACNRTPNEWGADLRAALSGAGRGK